MNVIIRHWLLFIYAAWCCCVMEVVVITTTTTTTTITKIIMYDHVLRLSCG